MKKAILSLLLALPAAGAAAQNAGGGISADLLAKLRAGRTEQAADRALLTAMEAIEAEMTQNERTKEGNPG